MDEPRIMHLFATMERGGAELRTLELMQALGDEARLHRIVTLAQPGGALACSFRSSGATTTFLRAKSPMFIPSMWRLARRHRVVHSHLGLLSGVFLAIALAARTPVRIAHFRSDGEDAAPSAFVRVRRLALKALVQLCATDIIGVSPGALSYGYSKKWETDPRCQVVHSGLRLTPYETLPATTVAEAAGLAPGQRTILHVGRDHPAKNRLLAIEVMAALGPASDFELVFVGRDDASALAHQKQLARSTGVSERVHWLGERDDVPELLRSADAVLSTSLREGLPGAVIEGVASGTPVVASSIPGSVYLSEHFPGAISLVSPNATANEWAEMLRTKAAGRPSQEDRDRGLARIVASEFAPTQALKHFRDLWEVKDE